MFAAPRLAADGPLHSVSVLVFPPVLLPSQTIEDPNYTVFNNKSYTIDPRGALQAAEETPSPIKEGHKSPDANSYFLQTSETLST